MSKMKDENNCPTFLVQMATYYECESQDRISDQEKRIAQHRANKLELINALTEIITLTNKNTIGLLQGDKINLSYGSIFIKLTNERLRKRKVDIENVLKRLKESHKIRFFQIM